MISNTLIQISLGILKSLIAGRLINCSVSKVGKIKVLSNRKV
jgi:hypothetical protein